MHRIGSSRTGLVLAACGLAAVALAGCDVGPTTEKRNSYEVPEAIAKLVLTGTEGDVRVVAGDGPVTVAEKIRFSGDEPTTSHRVDGSTLLVDVDGCGKSVRVDTCAVEFDIRVPAATEVEVTLVAGQVDVRDVAGNLSVESTAGAIEATGLRGQQVRARTEAGEVTLTHAVAPLQATARTKAGAVTVTLPGGQAYAVDASSDAGATEVTVPTDAASTHRVTALTEAGRVRVASA